MSAPDKEFVTFKMARTANGGTVTTQAERVGGVLFTKRRARWLRGYLQAMSEGAVGDAATIRGARLGGVGGANPLGDLVVKRKMEAFLAMPDVQQAIRNVYDEVGFTLDDAVSLHVRHIRGEITKEEVTKDGEVVQVKLAPNYAALKDYIARATPSEPKRMHVLTARVGQPREQRTDGSAPPMSPRAIGETIEQG